jgi:hypothetical protein
MFNVFCIGFKNKLKLRGWVKTCLHGARHFPVFRKSRQRPDHFLPCDQRRVDLLRTFVSVKIPLENKSSTAANTKMGFQCQHPAHRVIGSTMATIFGGRHYGQLFSLQRKYFLVRHHSLGRVRPVLTSEIILSLRQSLQGNPRQTPAAAK